MLLELQRSWTTALLDPESREAGLLGQWQSGQRSADEAFAIYVNNIRSSVFNALRQSFPATQALAGNLAMQRAALRCLRHAPPCSGDLGTYGAALIDEITYWVANDERGVIREVARYEWTIDQLLRKPREQAWSLSAAAAVPAHTWPRLHLRLVDHSCVFESAVAVRAWRKSALDGMSNGTSLPTSKAECVLLFASDADVGAIELTPSERGFLRELCLRRNLEQTTQAAIARDANLALQPLLAKLLTAGVLVAFDPVGGEHARADVIENKEAMT